MIKKAKIPTLVECLDEIGLSQALRRQGSALIKINLARPPAPGHPRTDPSLLASVIRYILDHGCHCTVAECADGFLEKNLVSIGLEWLLAEPQVKIIDLDFEECDCIRIEDEEHYLPKCLRNYGVRIAIPATSKRPDAVFSNNIKLFVGAVPRKFYQIGESVRSRPKIHLDLHKSVANLYRAIMAYAPFGFFINGGTAFNWQ